MGSRRCMSVQAQNSRKSEAGRRAVFTARCALTRVAEPSHAHQQSGRHSAVTVILCSEETAQWKVAPLRSHSSSNAVMYELIGNEWYMDLGLNTGRMGQLRSQDMPQRRRNQPVPIYGGRRAEAQYHTAEAAARKIQMTDRQATRVQAAECSASLISSFRQPIWASRALCWGTCRMSLEQGCAIDQHHARARQLAGPDRRARDCVPR